MYKRDGKVSIVKARKEVLLAAGTVATAKLLLLSGVGPRNHLQALKVHKKNYLSTILDYCGSVLLAFSYLDLSQKIYVGLCARGYKYFSGSTCRHVWCRGKASDLVI